MNKTKYRIAEQVEGNCFIIQMKKRWYSKWKNMFP